MSFEFLLLWLSVIFPLVFSPGPGNILCAISGATNTFKGSIPFILGLDLVYSSYAVLIGVGLGSILKTHEQVFNIIQILGVLYIFYLSISFFRKKPVSGERSVKLLTFKDGVISQALNIKGISIVALMYSQFTNTAEPLTMQVITLTLMLTVLNLLTHMTWAYGGSWMVAKFASERAQVMQKNLFGTLLFLVAIWLLPIW